MNDVITKSMSGPIDTRAFLRLWMKGEIMKKIGLKLATGLIFAGTLAMSGFIGGVTSGNAQARVIDKTETVDYKLEENYSDSIRNGMYKVNTDNGEYCARGMKNCEKIGQEIRFDTLREAINSLSKGRAYALVWLKGYGKQVLVVPSNTMEKDGKIVATRAAFYTKTHGSHVKFVGELDTQNRDYPIKIKDGVIYTITDVKDCGCFQYVTYLVAPDGSSLMPKDIIESTHDGDKVDGFLRKTNTDNNIEIINSGGYRESDEYRDKYNNAKNIEFNIN